MMHPSTLVLRRRGFTLIEMMVTVAIVAILASIAYPSYKEHITRTYRADAKTVLLENAQWMERQYTISSSYAKKGDGTAITTTVLPLQASPRTGTTLYDISFTADPTDQAFTLQAVPTAGNSMASDACGTLTLTSAYVRNIKNLPNGSTATVQECWDR